MQKSNLTKERRYYCLISQREFFNLMAGRWDTVCTHDTKKIEHVLDLLSINNGAKILDVGTGTGILIPFLSERVGEEGKIIAIDISEKMLEVAQQKYSYRNTDFVCGDVLEADLQKEFFDLIICYSVFPHFNDKQTAISVISKCMKKGGKFVIFHSQSRAAINNLHKNSSETVAEDNLPDICTIRTYFLRAGLNTTAEIDNSEMFVVVGEK